MHRHERKRVSFTDTSIPYIVLELQATLDEFAAAVLALTRVEHAVYYPPLGQGLPMSRLEFASTRFLPYLPESCQIGPGVYGYELASWLSQVLAKAGFATSYPVNEEWGWYLEYVEDEAAFMIGCGCEAEEGDGYRGESVTWYVFVMQNLSLQQCLKGVEVPDLDVQLLDAVTAALRKEGIEPVQVE